MMGITKTENYTESQLNLANIAKVLGHPARIAILQAIIQTNKCVCGELVNEIGLAQATISQHLKELKNAGMIKGTIEGTSVCYCIDDENWIRMSNELRNFFDYSVNAQSKCC